MSVWPLQESPEQIAARLWVRRHSGSWNERDEKALREWLAASPDHQDIYDRVVAVCELAGDVQVVRHSRSMTGRSGALHWRALGVVCLLALICIPIWSHLRDWWSGTPITWIGEANSPRTVTLADGTRIELDAGSQIVTQWGSRARHATLLRGEALFSVRFDAKRPLVVDAGRGRLTDLGTVFDVATSGDSIEVSVLEGRVGLSTHHGEVVLTAGHQGGYAGTGELTPVAPVDPDVTSWRQGVRRFDSVALPEVLEILSRRHGVQLSVTDAAAREQHLSGSLQLNDLQLSLRTLATALQLRVRWIDAHHVELSTRTYDDTAPIGAIEG